MKRYAFLVFALVVFFHKPICAQDRSNDSAGGNRQQTYVVPGLQDPIPGPPSRGGLIADNLDRVAATAQQLLEILSRDAGLAVELKRWIAEDAGEGGALLEESDLDDDAVAQRLREDLRTRVIATRLLRKYGYLLPQLNPDSAQAQQERLVLQERAQELALVAQRRSRFDNQLPAEVGPRCDSRQTDCGPPAPRFSNPSATRASQSEPVSPDYIVPDGNRPPSTRQPEILSSPREPHVQTTTLTSTGSLPASPLSIYSDGARLNPDVSPSTGPGSFRALAASGGIGVPEPSVSAETHLGGARSNGSDLAVRSAKSSTTEASPYEPDPTRLVHRPNPYADVPSLYDLYVQANASSSKPNERFGLDVFRHGSLYPDVLPMDLPVGREYVLGPGDGLSIDMWGGVSQRLFQTIDREGKVVLPEAGPLLVSGKSLGEAQLAVQRALRTQFRDVSADVSLLKLRTVRVYVVGEVAAPGAYDVSSLSTALNALFAAGGVTPAGSLRRLQHYRGSRLLEEVDGYDLLLHGIRGNMERLENGDSLRVPPVGSSVNVDGMVRRPAVYELRGEADLSEVLDLAGGLLPAAALRHIEVQRLEIHEKRSMLSLEIGETTDKDALRAALEKFQVRDGDEIHIFPIAPYNAQSVYLEGHVLRPGRYAYHDGMKLTDLISSRGEMLPEPSERYAEIIHIQTPENRPAIESFSLAAALEHPETAPKLQPLDTVRIFGRYDFEGPPEFSVFGEVRRPGRYRSSGEAHLRDAIYLAGGVTPEAWEDSAQLFRAMPDGGTKVFGISLRAALAGDSSNNILVEPRDRIVVHRQPERINPANVYVRGEVARPGRYPLTTNMTVSDLLRSAGGLLRSANGASGDLTHYAASSASATSQRSESHTIDLAEALAGDQAADLSLRDGDVLTVPQRTGWRNVGASVAVTGEVVKPGVYGIQPGERLSSLLRRVGGLLPTAYPQAAVFERVEVRAMQRRSRQELMERLEQEPAQVVTSISASATEETALQRTAAEQHQRLIDALRRAPISGRMVVHLRQKSFAGSADDIELRAGDTLDVPKQPGSVIVVGQVYNSTAMTYSPGKNAGWYLSHAGGPTPFANKRAAFIIRADGSVTSGTESLWSGGVLSSPVRPGDTIVVPEKALTGGSGWKNAVAIAQIAQAAALAAAIAIP